MVNLSSSHSTSRDSDGLYAYKGNSYTDEVDRRLPPDQEEIDARFGSSTGIGDRFGRGSDSDHTFSTGYQSGRSYKTRTGAPRGILDDV